MNKQEHFLYETKMRLAKKGDTRSSNQAHNKLVDLSYKSFPKTEGEKNNERRREIESIEKSRKRNKEKVAKKMPAEKVIKAGGMKHLPSNVGKMTQKEFNKYVDSHFEFPRHPKVKHDNKAYKIKINK